MNAMIEVEIFGNNDINNLTKVSFGVDCGHHTRNTWSGAEIGPLTKHFMKDLSEELTDIDSHLRVNPDPEPLVR